ncbi:MAG TPA: cation transporter [Anaerolineales bacterium]|nr:cation transporter [Anaerolineales bacterium]
METTRPAGLRLGIRIEVISILWMVVEMAVSIGAGLAAGSILLTAFGLDSLIELISGGILLWRLRVESRGENADRIEQAEHTADWIVAVALGMLCIYVLISAVLELILHSKPETSLPGIGVSAAAVLIMPYLAFIKRRVSGRIGSKALAGDAVESITCAYMAGTVLIGLALNTLFGWWWAEPCAALVFLVWLGRETVESFNEARGMRKED